MDAVDCVALLESLGDNKHTFVGRFGEGLVDVIDFQLAVLHKSVHPLANHAQSLLDDLLESAAYGHHFADRFHRRADFAAHTVEFPKIPAGNLADDVVERRLEEGRCLAGHGVLEVEQPVAKAELGGHECQGITGRLRREGRRTAQSGVDLNHTVIHRVGVVGILDVAFADDSDMADNLDGKLAQVMVVVVGECLGGGHDDRLAGVDSQWIEVLHIADRDAVVIPVADNLILDLFPSLERLLNQHLR